MTASRKGLPSMVPTQKEIEKVVGRLRGPETMRSFSGERVGGREVEKSQREDAHKTNAQRADAERRKRIRLQALWKSKKVEFETAKRPLSIVAWIPPDTSDRIWSILTKRMPSEVEMYRNSKTVVSIVCPREYADDVSGTLSRCGLRWGEG